MTDTAPHLTVIPWDGKPITKPGIYSGIPMAAYHSATICDGPSVSSTVLRKVEELQDMSKVFDKHWAGNPDREPEKEKPAYVRGRARHTLLLGEQGFREEFLIRPETYPDGATYPSEIGTPKPWHGGAKWCKAWMAAAQLAGKSVLQPEEIPNVRGAAERLAAHPAIQEGLLNGLIEHSIFWKDEATGLWVKVRPDVIPTQGTMVADYKGTEDASPLKVRRAITDLGYHQQLALVADGLFQVAGLVLGADDHVLVFQEWSRPFSINIKPVMLSAIYRGRQQNRRALNRIAECLQTGVWPGPDDDMVPAGLMDYREKTLKFEEENGLLPEIEEPSEGSKPKTITPASQAIRDQADAEEAI